jgi:3-oxoacyl-[acyl-carrier protein] reductase
MSEFENKVAIVTGGSSGIGETIASLLAERGARVAVVASSRVEKAQAVADRIKADGGVAQAYAADVRDSEAVKALVAAVQKDLGGIDILVNAAGVFYPTPLEDTSRDDLDRMVDINLKGTWNMTQAVVPVLKERGSGKILNFASVAGVAGVRGFALYCATKASIVMLTRVLGAELAPFNINVNALAPGNTATPMNEAIRNNPEHKAELEAMAAVTPSNVTFSDPIEIAEAGLYLLSRAARPVMGTTLLADEGFSATVA